MPDLTTSIITILFNITHLIPFCSFLRSILHYLPHRSHSFCSKHRISITPPKQHNIHQAASYLNHSVTMSSPLTSTDPASSSATSAVDLTQSGVTIPSDSENYGQSPVDEDISHSSDSAAPLILYSPPTLWGLVRGAAINLFLPFINGLMLGFGELFAHEIAFRLGWSGTKVSSS
jgi:hypothetical protein